jgi:SRSO17 transposase
MTVLIETTPKMDLALHDIAHLVEELRAYHAISSPRFQRREPRAAAHTSLQGWLAPLPRKSIEPMVLAVDGVAPKAVRALQSCSREGRWHDAPLWPQHWQEVETDLGADEGVLMVDGSDVPKQGGHAGGVKRQSWGELGQRATCPAGVCVGSVSPQGSTWRDRRLSLPVAWRTDAASAARRRPCGLPSEITCKPKPALAQARLAAGVKTPRLRCRWVVADEACGDNPSVREGGAGWGLWYGADVPPTTRVWAERPAPPSPPWRGRGRRPPRERLVEGAPEARTVREVAAALPAEFWTRPTLKEGSQGPMVAAFAALRVVAVRDTWPGPDVWLVRRRPLETGEVKTSLSNAPVDTAWATPGRMRGRRWPMATCFEDGKPLLGMGDDAVRSWAGWPHQMTWVMLAHFFVVHMRLR